MDAEVIICRRCGFASSCRRIGDLCPSDDTLLLPRQTLVEHKRDPAVGRLLAGRFLILGAMVRHDEVTLYRGRDLVIDAPVAIKTVAPYAVGAPARIERLSRESRVLRRIEHATLPRFIAGGREDDGLVWVVQDALRGVSLRALLTEKGRLSPNRAINIALRVLAALDRLHAAGLSHADLRPENILITPRGLRGNDEIKLIDCGTARPAGQGGQTRFDGLGACYRAPEQLTGQPVDATTDIYGLGAILFEMLAGRPPFDGPTPFEQMRGHCRTAVPSLGLEPAFGPLEGVVYRALEKAPARRWRSARGMAIALKAAFVTRDGGERLVPSSAPPAARSPEDSTEQAPAALGSHRMRAALALMTLAVA